MMPPRVQAPKQVPLKSSIFFLGCSAAKLPFVGAAIAIACAWCWELSYLACSLQKMRLETTTEITRLHARKQGEWRGRCCYDRVAAAAAV